MDLLPAHNNSDLKKHILILKHIFMKKNISRPELLKTSKLKIATLYRIIDELVARNMVLVQKNDETTSVGRPSDTLSINGSFAFIFTISVQRFTYTVAMVDFSGKILLRSSFACNKETKPETVIDACHRAYADFLKELSIAEQKILGISLVTFGVPSFRADKDCKIYYPVYPGFTWNNFEKGSSLEKKFNKKVRSDFNARAAVWGNFMYKYQQELSNLVYIIINEGIGTGVVINGQILEGGQRIINGLGHMVVDINGQRCPCGKYGCIETKASETAIYHNFLAELRLGKESILSGKEDTLDSADILEAADNGDPLAIYVVDNAASIFSIGLENYLNILEIQLIVLGGAVPIKSALFCEATKKRLQIRFPGIRLEIENNEEEILLKGSASAFLAQTITDGLIFSI